MKSQRTLVNQTLKMIMFIRGSNNIETCGFMHTVSPDNFASHKCLSFLGTSQKRMDAKEKIHGLSSQPKQTTSF